MRGDSIDPELFVGNRERLRGMLKPKSIVIVHSNDIMPTNADGVMPHIQHSDLLYLSGIHQEQTVLVLFPDAVDEREREILFVKETSDEIAVWEGEKLKKDEAAKRSGVERVEWTSSFEAWLHRLVPQAEIIYLATNEHLRAATVIETANDRFVRQCQQRYPLHHYERLAPLTQRLRMIKQPEELRLLKKACEITGAGFRRVLDFIRPEIGEWEIEAEWIHEFVRRGSRGFAYQPIIGSGANACVLHYLENKKRCADGELVLMDVGAEWCGWNADLTRTVPVNGRFNERQRGVYDAVLRVMRAANEILRPGNTPKEYQEAVLEVMEAELVNLGLISAKEAREQSKAKPLVKKYFMHGTSHHLGIDVHDVSPAHEPFAEGMVFTIEPGIYIREEGIGVRLENDLMIGKDANDDLMADIPIEAEEIEEIMNGR